jgi:hypothetical protein
VEKASSVTGITLNRSNGSAVQAIPNPAAESPANRLMLKIWQETHEEYLNSKRK